MPKRKPLAFDEDVINNFFSVYLGSPVSDWKSAIINKEVVKKFVELDVYLFNIAERDDFINKLSLLVHDVIIYYDRTIGFHGEGDFYTHALEGKRHLFNNGNFESTIVLLRRKIKL